MGDRTWDVGENETSGVIVAGESSFSDEETIVGLSTSDLKPGLAEEFPSSSRSSLKVMSSSTETTLE